jgi:hypothetical protein
VTDEYDDGDDRYRSKFYRGLTAEKHRKVLRDVAIAAVNATRAKRGQREAALAADWKIQTSNSFRRIGGHGDGDVLCGTTHPIDRHPDLLAPPGVLEYVVAAQPRVVLSLLDTVEKIEREVFSLQDQLPNASNASKIAADLQAERTDRHADPYRTKPARTFTVDVDFVERLLQVLGGVGAMDPGGWDRHHALVAEVKEMLGVTP